MYFLQTTQVTIFNWKYKQNMEEPKMIWNHSFIHSFNLLWEQNPNYIFEYDWSTMCKCKNSIVIHGITSLSPLISLYKRLCYSLKSWEHTSTLSMREIVFRLGLDKLNIYVNVSSASNFGFVIVEILNLTFFNVCLLNCCLKNFIIVEFGFFYF